MVLRISKGLVNYREEVESKVNPACVVSVLEFLNEINIQTS